MIGKVKILSWLAESSKLARRRCQVCRRIGMAERVGYGKGGLLLFFACGHVRDSKRKGK